jgi:hypothetical protein
MGRKSAAKTHSTPSPPAPPGEPKGVSPVLIAAAVLAVVAIIGALTYARGSRDAGGSAASAAPAAALPAAQIPAEAPAAAKLGPHPQPNLPPLPFQAYAPPRPPDVVRADYVFAAEHPEILSYVPCFCGCERAGHRGNEDCFVARRDDRGDVTEWEPHGLDCAVCLDVATEARQMFTSGASARDIRAAIEKKWAGQYPNHTPTALPPK